MNLKKSVLHAVILSGFSVSGLQAEPFSTGTVLTIEPGIASGTANDPCISGSCFGMEVSTGFWIWTNFGAGTDGGASCG